MAFHRFETAHLDKAFELFPPIYCRRIRAQTHNVATRKYVLLGSHTHQRIHGELRLRTLTFAAAFSRGLQIKFI